MAVTINGDTGIDKVQDGSIHDVDIDSVSASKLTGDLPAISGVNLTDLPVQGQYKRTVGCHYHRCQ